MRVINMENLSEKITTMQNANHSIKDLTPYELRDFPDDILLDLENTENREAKNYYLNWLIYSRQVEAIENKKTLSFK